MLKLKNLKLTNFMSISNAELNFESPVILISGDNASGKSSIIDALAVCLLERKRSDSYKDYVQYSKDTAEIYLDASVGDNPIIFKVSIAAAGSMSRDVEYMGKKYHNSEVSGLLDSLGFNEYGDLLFSMQGGTDITSLTPTQRLNYLKNLLNFDYSEIVKKIADSETVVKEDAVKISHENDFLEKSIESRLAEKKEPLPLPCSQVELSAYRDTINSYREKFEDYNKVLADNNKTITEINNIQKGISEKQSEKVSVVSRKAEISASISSSSNLLERSAAITAELGSLKPKLEEYINERPNIENEISEKNNLLKETESKIGDLNRNISNLDIRMSSVDSPSFMATRKDPQDIVDKVNQIGNVRVQLKETEIKLESLKQSIAVSRQGKCPTCGSEFSISHIKNLEENQSFLEKTLKDLNEILYEKIEGIRSYLSEQRSALKTEQGELDIRNLEVTKEIADLNGVLTQHDLKIADMRAKVQSLETEFERINSSVSGLEKLKNELNSLTDKEKAIEETLLSLSNKIMELQKSVVSIEPPDPTSSELAQSKIDEYEKVVENNHVITQTNNTVDTYVKESKETIENNKQKLTDFDILLEKYKSAKTIFEKNLPNFMVVKTCARIQSEMNQFIQGVFPNIEVKLFHNKKGVEFYYTTVASSLREEEKTISNMRNIKMASGFEKALLTSAFKEALCKAYGLPFCVLDEVDAAASEENSERLFGAIICGGTFNQSIIITHKPPVRDIIKRICPHISYKVELGEITREIY